MITICVQGSPAPQGSKAFKGIRNGRAILVESSKQVKPWRESVKWACAEALKPRAGQGIRGPVLVEIIFTLRKPASAPKRMRTWPEKKPDIDKLCRSVLDSLVDAGVIDDDARVIRLSAEKVFPAEHPDAMAVPGAVIRVVSALLADSTSYSSNSQTRKEIPIQTSN